jgi:hypothetical protein
VYGIYNGKDRCRVDARSQARLKHREMTLISSKLTRVKIRNTKSCFGILKPHVVEEDSRLELPVQVKI